MDETAKRVVSAYHDKEGRHGPEELFPMSSPFTSSALAARVSGGARPPRPSVPPSKKKRRLPFVPPPPRTTAPPRQEAPPASDYHRQEAPPTIGGLLPRQEEPWPFGVNTEFSPIRSPIFDWSLNASTPTEDLMASGYEPYIDMLTQDADDADVDLQLVMQPTSSCGKGKSKRGRNFSQSEDADADLQLVIQPTSSSGKATSRRGSNFSQSEDIQLCISWMNVGSDSIVGTDQPRTAFWQRIANDFHQNKDFESDRTANSLEHRCTTILKDCMQFHAYYEDIQRRRPSGVPHQEHLIAAQARYAGANKGKSFQFIQDKMKQPSKQSKSRERGLNLNLPVGSEDEGQQEAGQGQENSSNTNAKQVRPLGRKQSKEKLRRSDDEEEYKNIMKNLMVMKAEEHAMRKERLDMDKAEDRHRRENEQRRLEIEERNLQWKREERIMFCDISNMDEHQKTYILNKRAEIARMTSLSASVGDTAGVSVSDSVHFSSV